MDIQTWAFVIGLAMGTVCLATACFVWLRIQMFGMGGSLLCLVGVILLGLSIWSTARITISPDGVTAEFIAQLAHKVDENAEATAVILEEVRKAGEGVEDSKTRFLELARSLEAEHVIDPTEFRRFEASIEHTPTIDSARIDSVARVLGDQRLLINP